MNRDPFGLGVLLYGGRFKPGDNFTLRASGWSMDALSTREFELVHGGCSISTFCRNPLHPGPCKGWKKSLGVNAPGALTAIEKARQEKVAARRVMVGEAKSAAAKNLRGDSRLHSPLHAKKATTKHANVLLGDDEAKAGKKADRVILNKGEIKKYSKIKDAQVNGMRTKHGLTEDPGLEDRIAAALAKDNEEGKDANFRSVLGVSAQSLGAQLADKHCKKLDGDCDGKLFEGLRDKLSADAEHALLTGDDSGLNQTLADYKAGKFSPAPKLEPTVMQGDKLSGPAKHTIGGNEPSSEVLHMTKGDWDDLSPQEKAKISDAVGKSGDDAAVKKLAALKGKTKAVKAAPEKAPEPAALGAKPIHPLKLAPPDPTKPKKTLAQAGLTIGDKAVLHTKDGPVDVTVQKSTLGIKKKGGSGQVLPVYQLHDKDGNVLAQGAGTSKYPVEKVGAPAGPSAPGKTNAPAAPKAAKPADDFTGGIKGDGAGENAIKQLKSDEKLDDEGMTTIGKAITPAEFKTLSDAEKTKLILGVMEAKQNGHPEADAAWANMLVVTTDAPSAIVDMPEPSTTAKLVQDLKDSAANASPMDPSNAVTLANMMTTEDVSGLSGPEKMKLAGTLYTAKQGGHVGAESAYKRLLQMANDKKKSPPKLAPGAPVVAGHPATAMQDALQDDASPQAILNVMAGMSKSSFDGMSEDDKAKVKAKIHQLPEDHPKAKLIAGFKKLWFGETPPPATPKPAPVVAVPSTGKPLNFDQKKAVDFATGAVSGKPNAKKAAYDILTGDEFKDLEPAHQKAILSDLDAIHDSLTGVVAKAHAAQVKNYLQGYLGLGSSVTGFSNGEKADLAGKFAADFKHLLPTPFAHPPKDLVAKSTSDFMLAAHNNGTADHAANELSKQWAESAVNKLYDMHDGTSFELDPAAREGAIEGLGLDIKKKLLGEGGPTPALNAWLQADKFAGVDDAGAFMTAAHSVSGGSPAVAIGTPKASVPGGAAPLGAFGESIDFPDPHGSTFLKNAKQGTLFSAYKSAHKGSVLSHSIEDNYNNLLAVAAHYKGKEVNGLGYPDDLSVLQVARTVDLNLSDALGVANANVLETRIANWLATPEGMKYAKEHPQPGQKWVDNLSGAGSGASEAKKIGLTLGAPVGKRVQKPKAKPPKYDANKAPEDFQNAYAGDVQTSQTKYMDDSGEQWTPGQSESLANYTTGAYYELNTYLRGNDGTGKPVNTISNLGLERVALIQAGMRPIQEDLRLKRGTGFQQFPIGFRTHEDVQKLIGRTFVEDAFMSTTVGGESGEMGGDVQLDIEAPKGTPAAWVKQISHNQHENELVLGAGQKFRVLGVSKNGGQTVVRVRVVG